MPSGVSQGAAAAAAAAATGASANSTLAKSGIRAIGLTPVVGSAAYYHALQQRSKCQLGGRGGRPPGPGAGASRWRRALEPGEPLFTQRDHVLDGRKFAFLPWKVPRLRKRQSGRIELRRRQGGAIAFAMPSGVANDPEGTRGNYANADDVKSDHDVDDECVEECACESDSTHGKHNCNENSATRPQRTIRAWRVRRISSSCSIWVASSAVCRSGMARLDILPDWTRHSCAYDQEYHGSPSWWRARLSKVNKRLHAGRRQCGSQLAQPAKH